MTPSQSAYDITNQMIQDTAEGIKTGDFDLFMRHFALPFIMETLVGKQYFQSRLETKRHFDGVRKFREENGIVDSVRQNISAEFYDAQTISLTHISHLYKEDGIVFDRPYPTHSIIRYVDGKWLIHYCQYAVDDMDAFFQEHLQPAQ